TLIGAYNRAYLRVRNPNTGAPAGAGPVLEAVLDKVNSLFKRLNLYGYRHYHSFDGWMRQSLIDAVQQVLLDPETLQRGVYREGTIRRLIDEARSGNTKNDYLFQVLVPVELWQRENL